MSNKLDKDDEAFKTRFEPKKVVLKDNYKFYNKNIFFRINSVITIYLISVLFFFYRTVFMGQKTKNKRKYKKYIKGNVIVANHTMQFDGFYHVILNLPQKVYITMLQSNLGFGVASRILRNAGAVPIPEKLAQMKTFLKSTASVLDEGKTVLLFPEANINLYCDHIRSFDEGAVKIAYYAHKQLCPMITVWRKAKGWYKLIGRKWCPTICYLEPYTIKEQGSKKETTSFANRELQQIITDYFNSNSENAKIKVQR